MFEILFTVNVWNDNLLKDWAILKKKSRRKREENDYFNVTQISDN